MLDRLILEIKHAFNSDGKEQVEWATQGSEVPFVRRVVFRTTSNCSLKYR